MVLRWSSFAHKGPESSNIYSGAINTLIVVCVFSWCRLLNVFAIDPHLGPLYFIIVKLFRDIFYWLFVFVIFAVSFQIGFANLTAQGGFDPTSGYPTGSLPVSFFTIIGDFNYIDSEMDKSPIGIAMLGIYSMIAQIMLVNLLIAMMGSTYNNVSDNSTEEWKFYRLEMVMETQTASFHPPPTNLIVFPIEHLVHKLSDLRNTNCFSDQADAQPLVPPEVSAPTDSEKRNSSGLRIQSDTHPSMATMRENQENELGWSLEKALNKMRLARDEVVNKEKEEDSTSVLAVVNGLQSRLRTLMNERENDRTFVEKRFKDLEVPLRQNGLLTMSGSAASAGAGGVGGGVGELRELVHELTTQNQQLFKQNQQILALLQQQYHAQQQLQQQVQLLQR